LSEDTESSEVTTRGKLEDIESVDVADINTWQVPGSLLNVLGGIRVDDEWALLHDIPRVSVFSLTSSGSFGFLHLEELISNSKRCERGKKLAGGGILGDVGLNDERKLWNRVDAVSSSHDERRASRGSDS
jgi:hypothetical protein